MIRASLETLAVQNASEGRKNSSIADRCWSPAGNAARKARHSKYCPQKEATAKMAASAGRVAPQATINVAQTVSTKLVPARLPRSCHCPPAETAAARSRAELK